MDPESKQPETPLKEHFPLPDKMPVMVLSNCFLLPGCFLPLFIFEERYRLMLKHALETDRVFCVGIRKRSCRDSDEVMPITTAGLIRAGTRIHERGSDQADGAAARRPRGGFRRRRLPALMPILCFPEIIVDFQL